MANNPCKFFLPNGKALSYDEVRSLMLENYDLLNPETNATKEKQQPESVQGEREGGDKSQKTDKTGGGNSGGGETKGAEQEIESAEEDGFAVPSESEMKTKRDKLKQEYDDAIKNIKETFSALINTNLGIVYDPQVEAQKLYNFHKALFNAAKIAIRLGVNDVQQFAASIGKKRVDKFTQRAWDDAQRDLNGRPTIINSEADMLNLTYQKVAESYDKQYKDAETAKKSFFDRLTESFHRNWFEADYIAKKLLKGLGATQAIIDKTLLSGISSRAKVQFDQYAKDIFGGLSKAEKELLNNIIQAQTIISIDERFDAKGEPRPKHPGDTSMEEQKVYLGQLAQTNPEQFKKLNARAEKYFDAQRELLKERLDEGRISIDSYNAMVNNNYSPRVFLEYLLEDNLPEQLRGKGSVSKSDIKSLSDGDVNSLFHDAEWLLSTNVLATNRSIFNNRANRSLYDFAKANPNNGLIEIQAANGISDGTGQPTYQDAPVGFKQLQFFDEGVKKSMLVPNEFYVSWVDNNPLINPTLANAFRVGTGGSIKRMFTTGINPVFALKNFPRDISHTLFFTNTYSPSFPVALGQLSVDLVKTFKDAMKMSVKDKNSRYYQYLQEGGGMDFLSIQGKPIYKQSLIKNKFDNGVEALSKTFGVLNNRSEVWVRLAIREREINKGVAKFLRDNGRAPQGAELERIQRNATYASRKQMDFSRGGKYAKAVDNFIPYFNAGLQGLSVSARYIHDNPKLFSIKLAQMAGIIAALTLYNSRYEDDEDDIPEEEKARNFIYMLPYKVERNGVEVRPFIRIPKTQSIQPFATMAEALTEWSIKGKKPTKAFMTPIESAIPFPNPQNIPIVDALNLYSSNYDRFLDRPVYKGEETTPDYLEFREGRTPNLWIDMGEFTGLSPERAKEAIGKLTADPDNNIFYILGAQAYDHLFANIPEEDKKPFTETFHQEIEKSLTPFQRSFMSYTNSESKNKTVAELEEEYGAKAKLQNDVLTKFVRQYTKGEKSETEVTSEFNEWLRTQDKETTDYDGLRSKFSYSMRFKDVDNVFWKMRSTRNPEVRAHIFFLDWQDADDNDKKVLETRAVMLELAPKDKSSKFWKEFNRLKDNYGK